MLTCVEPDDIKFGAWSRFYYTDSRCLTAEAGDGPDADSPRMWKNAGSPPGCTRERSREIARYRQEMLDFVREVPEAEYDLSLKHMVRLPPERGTPVELRELLKDDCVWDKERDEKLTRGGRRVSKAGSMEELALRLKLLSPLQGGGRQSSSSGSTGSKETNKPVATDGVKCRAKKGGGNEVWRREDRCNNSNSSDCSSITSRETKKPSGCSFPCFWKSYSYYSGKE